MTTASERAHAPGPATSRVRIRAACVSLAVGVGLLGIKYVAYLATGSAAILSDALESITNVVGAGFGLGSVLFAIRPADEGHPYGHGKIEYMSAVFEGGLISFAAVLIVWFSISELIVGARLEQIDFGLLLTVAAGFVNAALGVYLVRSGRAANSLTLIADGRHVLSDFKTSVGVVVGLVLVRITGVTAFDPLAALVVGLNLVWTGIGLVRHGADGLLDAEDTALLGRIVAAFDASAFPGIIRMHHLRAIRSGAVAHADAHLIVPEYWTVETAHEAANAFEEAILAAGSVEGGIVFHTDPCLREPCRICDVADCPVRRVPFESRPPLTVEEARGGPVHGRGLGKAERQPA